MLCPCSSREGTPLKDPLVGVVWGYLSFPERAGERSGRAFDLWVREAFFSSWCCRRYKNGVRLFGKEGLSFGSVEILLKSVVERILARELTLPSPV